MSVQIPARLARRAMLAANEGARFQLEEIRAGRVGSLLGGNVSRATSRKQP